MDVGLDPPRVSRGSLFLPATFQALGIPISASRFEFRVLGKDSEAPRLAVARSLDQLRTREKGYNSPGSSR
jgi:hypothetical protein